MRLQLVEIIVIVVFISTDVFAFIHLTQWKRYRRIIPLHSKENEYQEALKIAKQYDSEWLSKILDYKTLSNYSAVSAPSPPVDFDEQPAGNADELLQLGYNSDDIRLLKPTVRKIVLEKSVRKPRTGLPNDWIISSRQSASTKKVASGVKRRPPVVGDEEAEVTAEELKKKYYAKQAAMKNEQRRELEEEEAEGDAKDEKKDSGRGKVYDDGGSASFWPDTEEFKDMLLDESKWRIDIVGPWSAPYVREETKWRYSVYKKWLQFLDEGLGDGFDVLPNGFDEEETIGRDEDDEVDDDEPGNDAESSTRRVPKVPAPSSREQQGSPKSEAESRLAVRYEQWLRSQYEDAEKWEDRNKVERSEVKRQKDRMPSIRNKEKWFEDDDISSSSKSTDSPTKMTGSSRSKKGRSSPSPESYEDFDDI